jgi:hypothetical protein
MAELKPTSPTKKGKQRAEPQDKSQDDSQADPELLINLGEVYNVHIMNKIAEYQELDLQDNSLWQSFQLDFHGWTKETFTQCSLGKVEKLRELLRHYGVWVSNNFTTVGLALTNTLLEPELIPWTQDKMLEHLDLEGGFNSKILNSVLRKRGTLPQITPQHQSRTPQPSTKSPQLTTMHRLPQGGTPKPTLQVLRMNPLTKPLVNLRGDVQNNSSGQPSSQPPIEQPQPERRPIPLRQVRTPELED